MVLYASNLGPYGSSAAGQTYNLGSALAITMRNGGQVAPILKLLAKTVTKTVPINEQKKGGPQLITNESTANYTLSGKPTLLFRDTIPELNANQIKNYRDEWDDAVNQDTETVLTAPLATGATTMSIANGVNLGIVDSSGGRIQYVQMAGQEIIRVNGGAGTNTLTPLVRAQLGTSDPGTTYPVGTRVTVRQLYTDGADFVGGYETTSKREFNFTRIWRREFSLSGTAIATQTTGGLSQLEMQHKLRAHDIMAEMALDCIYGVRSESGSGANRVAMAAGVIRFGTTVNGFTFSKANIRSQIDQYCTNGGNISEAVVLCGVNVWGKVCDMKDLYVQNAQMMGNTELNFDLKTLKFYDFSIPFAQDNTLNPDDMLIINPNYADLVMVKGRELKSEVLGLTGDNRKVMMLAEGTIRVRLGSQNIRYYPNVA